MNRRGFLQGMAGILAAGTMPAIITTPGLLMPVRSVWTPPPFQIEHSWVAASATNADPLGQWSYIGVKCTTGGSQYGQAYTYSGVTAPCADEIELIKKQFLSDLRAAGVSV